METDLERGGRDPEQVGGLLGGEALVHRGDRHCLALRHRIDDLAQHLLLLLGVALHGLDQIGNEVVALLQLHVDIGEGLVGVLPQRDEAVVDADHQHRQNDDDDEDDGEE